MDSEELRMLIAALNKMTDTIEKMTERMVAELAPPEAFVAFELPYIW